VERKGLGRPVNCSMKNLFFYNLAERGHNTVKNDFAKIWFIKFFKKKMIIFERGNDSGVAWEARVDGGADRLVRQKGRKNRIRPCVYSPENVKRVDAPRKEL